MRFLVDTHVLIMWWNRARLPERVGQYLVDPQTEIVVSAASAWEIATKTRVGKLKPLDPDMPDFTEQIVRHDFQSLPISQEHGLLAGALPGPHRDPFDRMLAAQAIIGDIPILSIDDKLDAFGCTRIWE